MRSFYYLLDGHQVVACPDAMAWGLAMQSVDRRVALDHVDDVRVSTVFLGINHNHAPHGPPLLFETMVFVNDCGVDCRLYSTWDEAVAGHQALLARYHAQHAAAIDHAAALLGHITVK